MPPGSGPHQPPPTLSPGDSRLAAVLRCLRRIHHNVHADGARGELVRAVCDSLVEAGAYRGAWIILTDEAGAVREAMQAGAGIQPGAAEALVGSGDAPACIRATADQRATAVAGPSAACGACPLRSPHGGMSGLCAVVEREGTRYGVLGVSAVRDGTGDPGEREILSTLAEGLALALHDMQTQADLAAAVAALADSEGRYRRLVETMREGLWIVDESGRIQFLSPRLLDMLGYEGQELIGQPVDRLVAAPDQPTVRSQMERHRDGCGSPYEISLRTRDGREAPVLVSSRSLFDEDNRFRGALAIIADLTEHKRLEEQLLQARRMEAVGRLTGGIAHDFRNQLTVVQGYSELLLRDLPGDSPHREPVRIIKLAAEKATAITSHLISFSRKQQLRPQVLNLNAFLSDLATPLARMLGEDIVFAPYLNAEVVPVKVDPDGLQRAMINLAVNARDAMPDGGRLEFETSNVDLSERDASRLGATPGRKVVLTVRDTGVGMDPQTRKEAFAPFFTTKPVGKGSGLGLSAVYGFIRQSGGHIDVESEVGVGSTFRLYFSPADEDGAPAEDPSDPPRRQPRAILLVEDDPAVRRLAAEVLEADGNEVLQAEGPDQAIRLAQDRAGPIDVLITTLVMPHLSGPDLARELRRTRPGLDCLYVSGYASRGAASGGGLPEDAPMLFKPYRPDDLLSAVHRRGGGRS